jgi:hypothetical protein
MIRDDQNKADLLCKICSIHGSITMHTRFQWANLETSLNGRSQAEMTGHLKVCTEFIQLKITFNCRNQNNKSSHSLKGRELHD